jgi:hypothetical protein
MCEQEKASLELESNGVFQRAVALMIVVVVKNKG